MILPVVPYERVTGPNFFHIVKLKVSNLKLGIRYRLRVIDKLKLIRSTRI